MDAAAGAHAPAAPSASPAFSAVLQQKLAEPRRALADIRAEIEHIRSGRAFQLPARTPLPNETGDPAADPFARLVPPVSASMDTATSRLLELRQTASPGADPHGWRAMSREIGDQVVGDGFGALFERQIQQESGFAPDVVLGLRKSSAGAEGIAQLMPQYYPGVDRTDPRESLIAGAKSMRHYLEAWDGDVRRALASYNAGLGRVRQVVEAHGDGWERGLPAETRQYLAAILGPVRPSFEPSGAGAAAVFGGRGPGGVVIPPLDRVSGREALGSLLRLAAAAGSDVRAVADGRVASAVTKDNGLLSVTLDHGNGWTSLLEGLADLEVSIGAGVRRADVIGHLAALDGSPDEGALTFGVMLDGSPVDPARYLVTGN